MTQQETRLGSQVDGWGGLKSKESRGTVRSRFHGRRLDIAIQDHSPEQGGSGTETTQLRVACPGSLLFVGDRPARPRTQVQHYRTLMISTLWCPTMVA